MNKNDLIWAKNLWIQFFFFKRMDSIPKRVEDKKFEKNRERQQREKFSNFKDEKWNGYNQCLKYR